MRCFQDVGAGLLEARKRVPTFAPAAPSARPRQAAPVRHAAGSQDGDRGDGVDDLRHERHRAHARRHALAARLAALGDDHVDAERRRLPGLPTVWT